MPQTHFLLITTAALLTAGSAFAGPNCKKSCPKEGSDEGIYEVAEREATVAQEESAPEAREGRRERGERGQRRRSNPLEELGLSEEQQEEADAIMEVREQMRAIQKAAMADIYENILTDEQRAIVDTQREEAEKRRAEREAQGGERRERSGRNRRGGDKGLDL